MPYHLANGRYADTLPITLVSGTIAATAASTGIELGDRNHLRLSLVITGTPAGTNPTLDVVVQSSPDNSTWATVGTAFAQQTAAGTTYKLFGPIDRFVRVSETIGGTASPSFVRTVSGEAV